MQAQLQQAGEERALLLSLLQAAAQERVYLQSQLEWVLYGSNKLIYLKPKNKAKLISIQKLELTIAELQNLLESGKWQKADRQTWEVMLKAAG